MATEFKRHRGAAAVTLLAAANIAAIIVLHIVFVLLRSNGHNAIELRCHGQVESWAAPASLFEPIAGERPGGHADAACRPASQAKVMAGPRVPPGPP